ncbi:MAG: TorF family putative porin [Pseudolabrys sp.]
MKYRPVSTTANQFEFDIRAGFASDYIYRGTTLSDHKPAVGAAIEATFAQFYTGVSVASVKLPTQPSAEIAVSGGVRSKIGDIEFDLGATYYLYPGEIYYSARPKALIIGRRLSARVNGSPSRSG